MGGGDANGAASLGGSERFVGFGELLRQAELAQAKVCRARAQSVMGVPTRVLVAAVVGVGVVVDDDSPAGFWSSAVNWRSSRSSWEVFRLTSRVYQSFTPADVAQR